MKNFTIALGWVCAIVLGILFFAIIFQKQQNAHNENVMDKTIEMVKLSQNSTSPAIQLKNESQRERLRNGLKSFFFFIINVFSKVT